MSTKLFKNKVTDKLFAYKWYTWHWIDMFVWHLISIEGWYAIKPYNLTYESGYELIDQPSYR